MKILITNDDGIDALGIAALVTAARPFGECVVVAPDGAWSGCGHQTTTDKSIRVVPDEAGRFRVWGTPADCVRLGIRMLVPDVDLVLAGINQGANLGVDMIMSGTVAAAREAMWMGRPAVAISQYRKSYSETTWDYSAQQARRAMESILKETTQDAGKSFFNVNLPDVPDHTPQLTRCEPDLAPIQFDFTKSGDAYQFTSSYHDRPRSAGSDIAACFRGDIAISKVDLD